MPRVQLRDIELYYEESGSGPPLLLIHGLGGCAEDWEFQLPEFTREYRVIVPELRGFGRTTRGREPLSVACFAQDVWALMQHLGIKSCAVVGHSMGGAVAMQLTLDQPDAVTKLVVANSVPTFTPQTLRQHFEVWYRLLMMRFLGPKRIAQIGASRMYPLPVQQELRERSMARSRFNTVEGYTGALRALTRWSAMDRLDTVNIPVLIVASEHDYFPRDASVIYARLLPKGHYQFFPDMHHGLPTEAPGAFNAVVLKFLRKT